MGKYAAEFVGTFALVFAGTGAIVVNDLYGGIVGHLGISLTFGLVVMTVIYAIGDISGAHINPAVTAAFRAAGHLKNADCAGFIFSQFSGAIAAAITLQGMFPDQASLGVTMPSGTVMQSFLMELLLTFFLMFVILNVSTGAMEKGIMAGVAVGGTVALEALFAGPVSGASMNPARSLGPALASGQLKHLWLYLIATTVGALMAVPVTAVIRKKKTTS